MKSSLATLDPQRQEQQSADGPQNKLGGDMLISKIILALVAIAIVVTVAMLLVQLRIGEGV